MTELNLETVVLNGVVAVIGNVSGQVRMASNEAGGGAETGILSLKRHPSSKPALPEADRGPRYTATFGGTAVPRAGRLADLDGNLNSCLPSSIRWQRPAGQATGQNCLPTLAPTGPIAGRMPAGRKPAGRGLAMLRGR
jgi:hypothetical protein